MSNELTFPDLNELRETPAPVFHQYPSQTKPQDAYIELDQAGAVRVNWNGEIGNAVPFAVHHKRTLRWAIPETVRGSALAEFLERDDIRALLATIHDGHHIEWEGTRYGGHLSPEADHASEELATYIEANLHDEDRNVATISAMDWLCDAVGYVREDGTGTRVSHEAVEFTIAFGDDSATITRDTTAEEIADIERRIVAAALTFDSSQPYVITDSVSEYLDALQQELVNRDL